MGRSSAETHYPYWRLVAFLCAVVLLPGCQGCRDSLSSIRREEQDPAEPRKRSKPKPDFSIGLLRVLPHESNLDEKLAGEIDENEETDEVSEDGGTDSATPPEQFPWVKPGHWHAATQQLKANNFDYRGMLTVTASHQPPGGSRRELIEVEDTPFRMQASRPLILPKGQWRFPAFQYFIPSDSSRSTTGLNIDLDSSGAGLSAGAARTSFLRTLQPQEFFFVVLARNADQYMYVKLLPSVEPPGEEYDEIRAQHAYDSGALPVVSETELEGSPETDLESYRYYHVVRPALSEKHLAPLPENSTVWSSIAYILWDDVPSPRERLSENQQAAMLDWIHWGGQLIISGPNSLESLRATFLEPYLPAMPGDSIELAASDLAELDAKWTLKDDVTGAKENLKVTRAWPTIQLTPYEGYRGQDVLLRAGNPEGSSAGAPLVIERQVGRGRIVLTAFRLSERDFINWRGADGFFNACLLRRPAREYSNKTAYGNTLLTWADHPERRFDGRLATNLRIFSRDAIAPENEQNSQSSQSIGVNEPTPVATWNDFQPVSHAARNILRRAAGIEIPRAGFVLLVLFFYLVVLVPVNYAVFYLMRRLELAWVCVPLIAIGGAAAVIKLAQLDIGFASSKTEVAVLEGYEGYPRFHTTRYTALYTSLSNNYDLRFEDPGAVVLPFATDPDFKREIGHVPQPVTYHLDQEAELQGFPVVSNSTRMVHSEHVIGLSGPIRFTRIGNNFELKNETELPLRDVGILYCRGKGQVDVAWVGELDPEAVRRLSFRRARNGAELFPERGSRSSSFTSAKSLDLTELFHIAENVESLAPGEVRLVGQYDGALPGVAVDPEAPQAVESTFIIAHLRPRNLDAPQPDVNYWGPRTPTEHDALYLKD